MPLTINQQFPLSPRVPENVYPVIRSRLNALSAAELIKGYFPAKSLKYDSNLILRGVLLPDGYSKLLHKAPSFLGYVLGSFGLVFVFLGHNSILFVLFSLLSLSSLWHLLIL